MNSRQRFEMLVRFDRWGFDQKGWAKNTRYRYRTRVKQADVWLTAGSEGWRPSCGRQGRQVPIDRRHP